MNESDDITALALSYLRDTEAAAPQFGAVPRAPLARLIDGYLEEHPAVATRSALKAIADLNQGRLEDLNVPTFVSYILAKCDLNEAALRAIINTLRTYDSVLAAVAVDDGEDLLVAARDEDAGGAVSTTADEIQEQLKKRVQ